MEIDPLIEELSRDEESTPRELVERTARVLVAFSGGFMAKERDELLAGLVDLGRKLVAARPELAPLFHLVTELYARASEPADLVMVRRALRTAAVDFTQTLESRSGKVAAQAAALLEGGGRVLTFGRSPVVEGALLAAAKAGTLKGAVIGEGRPTFDGRVLATKLAAAGATAVKVVTDAALARGLADVDVVFLAASSVRSDHVVARVGTTALAAAAKQAGRPAWALAGLMSMLPADAPLPDPLVEGDPKRVWEKPPAGVTVANPRSERTPLKQFKGLVMETGTISPYDAEQRSRALPIPPWTTAAAAD